MNRPFRLRPWSPPCCAGSDFEVHTNFKGILLGGGPIDSSLVSEATGRGIPVINSYGMTETCAQITSHRIGPETAAAKRDSVGKVFTPNQIQIRSENGEVLESDQTGLIWLKGPQVFDGYIEASLNEHHFDPDGWFNTGDYGYMDRKGYVYISMRRTDQIVSGGKNINPHEIEQLLLEWSQIKEVAVVGIPDTEWGEQAIAVVIPADSDHFPTYEALKRYLESRVESYKIPKSIAVRDQLPKTPVGKIKRIELKKELANSIRD